MQSWGVLGEAGEVAMGQRDRKELWQDWRKTFQEEERASWGSEAGKCGEGASTAWGSRPAPGGVWAARDAVRCGAAPQSACPGP